MEPVNKKIEKALDTIHSLDDFDKVEFILHYGSSARQANYSDIDLAVYYRSESQDEMSEFRFKVLSLLFDDIFDIHIFQQLPLYIRVDVLKGNIVYCRNYTFLHDVAWETIKEFDDFKHRYYDYIGEGSIV